MSTSPLDPQDIRAAAEVYRELGPEYDDAVIAAFIDRVDRAVAARVEARLAEEGLRQPAPRDRRRRGLLRGVAVGVCAGALVAGVSIGHAAGAHQSGSQVAYPQGPFVHKHVFARPGPDKPYFRVNKPAEPPPPPAAPS